jgi:hypothetical protein
VQAHPHAAYRVPSRAYYRPYYTRWYVHPYYRYSYSTTVVVGFGFSTYAWTDAWAPPYRPGWSWVGGYWNPYGYWCPGYWNPAVTVVAPVGYAYVPGWWDRDVYVEGYYRTQDRNGWQWNEGYYLDDGTYVRGHWQPTGQGPEGYTWEPGFWDGETWVEGFWRPEFRSNYTWVSAYYDADGIFHAGYWMPLEQQPGYIWVPGWFDGNQWNEGYWESEDKYGSADLDGWQPEQGWNDGWQEGEGWGDGEVLKNNSAVPGDPDGPSEDGAPLAMPVWFDDDALQEDRGELPPI